MWRFYTLTGDDSVPTGLDRCLVDVPEHALVRAWAIFTARLSDDCEAG
jgi:hypothetical protein